MTDERISELAMAAPATGDYLPFLDVSDTAQGPAGSTRKALASALLALVSVPVSSVFGRTGAVVAANGDYAVGQVTGAAPLASPTFTGTVTFAAGSVVDQFGRYRGQQGVHAWWGTGNQVSIDQAGPIGEPGIIFGLSSDTYIYRSAASVLRFGGSSPGVNCSAIVIGTPAGQVGIAGVSIRTIASQSAPALKVLDVAGTVTLASISALGAITATAVTAGSFSYTAAASANWNSTSPNSVAEALDRIAAALGPIP